MKIPMGKWFHLTPAFWRYVQTRRPSLAQYFRDRNVTTAVLAATSSGRVLLIFPPLMRQDLPSPVILETEGCTYYCKRDWVAMVIDGRPEDYLSV